jgi:hypothetical protein
MLIQLIFKLKLKITEKVKTKLFVTVKLSLLEAVIN